MFVFTSDNSTKHVQDVSVNKRVAGSVVLETSIIGKIRGIQFTGQMYMPTDDLAQIVNRKYMLRFPFATLMNTRLWVVELDFIKFTDNRLGFGKKLIWKKEE